MLQDKAMLIKVSLSKFTPFKYDREMSNNTANVYGADKEYIRTLKRLVSKNSFKKISNADVKIRQFVNMNTRPWLDDGWRVLPTAMYFVVIDGINERLMERTQFVRAFVTEFPQLKLEAQSSLGMAYNDSDFPDDIESKFGSDVLFLPIPRAGDFRAEGLDTEDVAKIEADTLARIETQFQSNDLWKRVYDTVAHISERLNSYGTNEEGKVVNKFHDSLISNLQDLLSVLPKLNITNDAELDDMSKRLERELCEWQPQDLRDSSLLRKDVASRADQILADVAAFYGPAR